MIPRFAIFYDDDSIIEGGGEDDELVEIKFNVSKKWLEAPTDGVQAVVYEGPNGGKCNLNGKDHYVILPPHEFYCVNDLGPYLRKHIGIIKFGLCVSTKDYEEHLERIKAYNWETYQTKIKPYPLGDE